MLRLQDGITWLLNPPAQSLAFILADNGFEVWLANTRGTKYSLGHTSLISNNSVFLKNNFLLGFFVLLLNKLLSDCLRLIGTGHGMNWFLMIFLLHSNMYMIRQERNCTMLDIPW